MRPPRGALQRGEEEERDDREREQHGQPVLPRRLLRALPRLRRREAFLVDRRLNRGDTRGEAAVEILLPEMRGDHVLQDALGHRIGQRPLHAAADLEPQAAQVRRIVHRDHQDHAIVDTLASRAPGVGDANAVRIDRLGRGGRHHQHEDLAAALLLVLGQHILQRATLIGLERAGQVGHALGQGRHVDEAVRRALRERGPRARGQKCHA
ncbi:hypothetical protein CUPL110328_04060 [Cupriavidus plantarum]